MTVPGSVLFAFEPSERVVLDLGEGRYKSIAIELGRVGDEYAEVVAGLSPDERVVTSAQFLLDSESSKNSDFKRQYHGPDVETSEMDMSTEMSMKHSVESASGVKHD